MKQLPDVHILMTIEDSLHVGVGATIETKPCEQWLRDIAGVEN